MPAQAGIQIPVTGECIWIPAYAGMTKNAIYPRLTNGVFWNSYIKPVCHDE